MTILREYHVPNREKTDVWWMRVGVCPSLDILGVGTVDGNVYMYNIYGENPVKKNENAGAKNGKSSSSSSGAGAAGGAGGGHAGGEEDVLPQKLGHHCVLRPDTYGTKKALGGKDGPLASVRSVAFDVHGKFVAYCCDNSNIFVWRITKTLID